MTYTSNRHIVFVLLICTGCATKSPELKIGDYLSLKVDSSHYASAIVISNDLYSDHFEYGLCFTNYYDSVKPDIGEFRKLKICGRKIESYKSPGYEIGLDLYYLSDHTYNSNKDSFSFLGNLESSLVSVNVGSQSFSQTLDDLKRDYFNASEKRKLPPDNYTEIFKLEKFRPEEYLPIALILKKT